LASRAAGIFVTSLYGAAAGGRVFDGLDRRPRRLAQGWRSPIVDPLVGWWSYGVGAAARSNGAVGEGAEWKLTLRARLAKESNNEK